MLAVSMNRRMGGFQIEGGVQLDLSPGNSGCSMMAMALVRICAKKRKAPYVV